MVGHLGEIGSAISQLIKSKGGDVDGIDKNDVVDARGRYEVMHICIPWSDEFNAVVTDLVQRYLTKEGITIIHSTIPVGTTRKLGSDYVHSPCRGVHPNLLQGIKVFVKFFGGHRAHEASEVFDQFGVKVGYTSRSENTEAMKLWETEQYRRHIETMREIKEYCEDLNLDFDFVYTHANKTYNSGYKELGMGHVNRPVLYFMPGPTGGHCVEPNHKLLFPDEK